MLKKLIKFALSFIVSMILVKIQTEVLNKNWPKPKVGQDRLEPILFRKQDVAEDVMAELQRIATTYKFATVADLYELLDVPAKFGDEKWGWTTSEISNVRLEPSLDQPGWWELKFPRFVSVSDG